MKVTVRIYRTHDYDLMALCYSNAIKLGAAAKKALISFYKKEEYQIPCVPTERLPFDLPSSKTFILEIKNEEAPGIEEWFKNIRSGYKNQFVKVLLRYYIGKPLADLYALDTWMQPESEEEIPVAETKKKRKTVRKKEKITDKTHDETKTDTKTDTKTQGHTQADVAKPVPDKPEQKTQVKPIQFVDPENPPDFFKAFASFLPPDGERDADNDHKPDPEPQKETEEAKQEETFDAFDMLNSLK